MSIVYFARSIRGERKIQDDKINQRIIDTIRRSSFTCALDIHTPAYLQSIEGDGFIYIRDIYRLDKSNLMIAEVTHPSLGVGFEIAYATTVRRIPVFCLAQDESRISAMITGNPLTPVTYYDPDYPDGIEKAISQFLEKYEVVTDG